MIRHLTASALTLLVTLPSAQAASADALSDCSDTVLPAVNIPEASAADAIALCQAARRKLSFDPNIEDLRFLLKAAVVAQHAARDHDFDLPLVMVGDNLLDIAVLRGLAADRKGFIRTLELAIKIDTGTKGVVSPGALLMQLNASGPLAKTMSDQGVQDFAALVAVEENEKAEIGSFAGQQPLFAQIIGPWGVSGHIMAEGAAVMCQMSRGAEGGGEFAYSVTLANYRGVPVPVTFFRTPTTLSEGARPAVSVSFSGGSKFNLKGRVSGDTLVSELPSDLRGLQRLLDQFQHAKSMRIATARRGDAVTVDLAEAGAAFDANGQCLHESIERLVAQSKARL